MKKEYLTAFVGMNTTKDALAWNIDWPTFFRDPLLKKYLGDFEKQQTRYFGQNWFSNSRIHCYGHKSSCQVCTYVITESNAQHKNRFIMSFYWLIDTISLLRKLYLNFSMFFNHHTTFRATNDTLLCRSCIVISYLTKFTAMKSSSS